MKRPRLSLRVEELEGRLMLSAAPLTATSSNWSGYAVETNLNQPAAKAVTAVAGSWQVPAVTGAGTAYSSVWVGIDGYSSATVEQVGTEQDIVNGRAQYYAWYEMYPSYSVAITSLTIHAGDTITASVTYRSGPFALRIMDVTTGKSFTTTQTIFGAQRSSAEWIVEAPSSGFGVPPLANFGTATFTGASATLKGTAGPIDDSAWQSVAIGMASFGSTEDTTSSLTDTGSSPGTTSSFTVTYDAATSAPPPWQYFWWLWWQPDVPATQPVPGSVPAPVSVAVPAAPASAAISSFIVAMPALRPAAPATTGFFFTVTTICTAGPEPTRNIGYGAPVTPAVEAPPSRGTSAPQAPADSTPAPMPPTSESPDIAPPDAASLTPPAFLFDEDESSLAREQPEKTAIRFGNGGLDVLAGIGLSAALFAGFLSPGEERRKSICGTEETEKRRVKPSR